MANPLIHSENGSYTLTPGDGSFANGLEKGSSLGLVTNVAAQLAHDLSTAIGAPQERFAALVWSRDERLALTAVLKSIRDVSDAQVRLRQSRVLVPVRLHLLRLAEYQESQKDTQAVLAREVERQLFRILLQRVAHRGIDEAAFEDDFEQLTTRAGEAEFLQELERCGVQHGVDWAILGQFARPLWFGKLLSENRLNQDPSQWFVHELQRETTQLRAVLETHQEQARGRIKSLESVLDGVLGLTAGLVVGASLLPFAGAAVAVGGGLLAGGVVALLRMRADTSSEGLSAETSTGLAVRTATTPPKAPPDMLDLGGQFERYLRTLREVGICPTLVYEQASAVDFSFQQKAQWVRSVLAFVPDGTPQVFVSNDVGFFENTPEVHRRIAVEPSYDELHDWLAQRLAHMSTFTALSHYQKHAELLATRYALLSASASDVNALESMLEKGRIRGRSMPATSLRDGLVLRIRATFQIASDVVLQRYQDSIASSPEVGHLFRRVLLVLPTQWESDGEPKIDEATIARFVDKGRNHQPWHQQETSLQQKALSALSDLLELLSNRTWLVSRLGGNAAEVAGLIPEWSLVTKAGGRWVWSFASDGTPCFEFDDEESTQPPAKALAPKTSRVTPLKAVKRPSLEEVLEQYLGDYTPARDAVSPHEQTAIDTAPPRQQPVSEKVDKAEMLTSIEVFEFLDDILAQLSDDTLNLSDLVRVGLLPSVPSPEVVRQALGHEPDKISRYLIYESARRVQARFGIIEKFMMWVVAARTLCRTEIRPSWFTVAEQVVKSRLLSGKSSAEQHAMLPMRELRTQLRLLCPSTRDLPDLLVKGATPHLTHASIQAWGESLVKRCETLTWGLREGVSSTTLTLRACEAFEARLEKWVLEGELKGTKLTETIAYIEGDGPAYESGWSHGQPSIEQLTYMYAPGVTASSDTTGWATRALAALGLGLNQSGYALLGGPDVGQLGSQIETAMEMHPQLRRPLILVSGDDLEEGRFSEPSRLGTVLIGDGELPAALRTSLLDARFVEAHTEARDAGEYSLPQVSSAEGLIRWLLRYRPSASLDSLS